MALKKKYLADKINSLVSTMPTSFGSDDETENTNAKVVDQYYESDNLESNFQVSNIRRQNVIPLDQLDKRYTGKKISRKDICDTDNHTSLSKSSESGEDEEMTDLEQESDVSTSSDNFDNNALAEEDSDSENEQYDNKSNSSNEESNNDDDDDDGEDEYDVESKNIDISSYIEQKESIKFKTMSDTNVRADIDKGNCVRVQLKLWETLLEVRIKLQKCLVTSNQMPQYDIYNNFKSNTEFAKKVNDVKDKLKFLLNNMLELQSILLKQYHETKNLSMNNKKRKGEESTNKGISTLNDTMDEDILSNTEDEAEVENDSTLMEDQSANHNKNMLPKGIKFNNYEKLLNENHKCYIDYRNSLIQKWNEKTRLASGKISKGLSQTTLKQIEFALGDKEKLHKRVRLKRSEYKIIGKAEITEEENSDGKLHEYDNEIYDDNDFYHQLLRDLIEYKSSDITDPIQLSKQWIRLQNMRSKLKRKIDTRATKGRKIRYNVHNKLLNFMAPITINDSWSDSAKAELYKSLFGKIKSTNKI